MNVEQSVAIQRVLQFTNRPLTAEAQRAAIGLAHFSWEVLAEAGLLNDLTLKPVTSNQLQKMWDEGQR